MPRFSKLLCPIDFDKNSLQALALAGELTREARNATLDVLHVVEIPLGPEVAMPFDKLETKARTRLERLARDKLGATRYRLHVRTGNPDVEVLRVAEQMGSDLIVMATHGRKGLRRFLLGSVAEAVVREAPCPVLTVRQGAIGAKPPRTTTRRKKPAVPL